MGRKPRDFFSGRLGRYVIDRKEKIEVLSTPYHTQARLNIPNLRMDKYQMDAKMSGAFSYIREIPSYMELPVNPNDVKEEYVLFFRKGSNRLLTFGYTLKDVEKICGLFIQDDPDLLTAKKLLKDKAKFPKGSIKINIPRQIKKPTEDKILSYYEVENDGVVIIQLFKCS